MNKYIVSILIATLFTTNVLAQKSKNIGLSFGPTISLTGGIGVQAVTSYNNQFALRLGYEYFKYAPSKPYQYSFSGDGSDDDIRLDIYPNIKLGGLSLLLDWYPIKSLYVTGGIVRTNFNTNATLKSGKDLKINDVTYTPEQIGELNLEVTPGNNFAPYLGLGFGRNISSKKTALALSVELGTMFAKSHHLKVTGTEFFRGNSDNKTIEDLNKTLEEMSWAGLIPTLKIGLTYRFL